MTSALPPWHQRPPEAASLLNPAFCALVLRAASAGFERKKSQGMPLALSYLILPIILHPRTRATLPSSANAKHTIWLSRYPEARIGFSRRARGLVPFTREAILFALQHQAMKLDDSGSLSANERSPAHPVAPGTEVADCIAKAGLLGRWFADIQDVVTIFVLWGVRP